MVSVMGRRGKFGAADEQPLRCTQIDKNEVAGRKRVAVRLVCANATDPDMFAR